MRASVVTALMVLALSACNRREEDVTKAMHGVRLSTQQRLAFSIAGLRTRESGIEAVARFAAANPDYQRERYGRRFVLSRPHEDISLEAETELKKAPIYRIIYKKDYPNGAQLPSVVKSIKANFPNAVLASPETQSTYLAGEGISEDGIPLKRCNLGVSGSYALSSTYARDCGLMAKIFIDRAGDIVRRVDVDIYDMSYENRLSKRIAELERQHKAILDKTEFDAAEVTNRL